jgi:hypothetical protein
MTFWNDAQGSQNPLGWRVSLVLVFIPAVIFMIGVPFLKES